MWSLVEVRKQDPGTELWVEFYPGDFYHTVGYMVTQFMNKKFIPEGADFKNEGMTTLVGVKYRDEQFYFQSGGVNYTLGAEGDLNAVEGERPAPVKLTLVSENGGNITMSFILIKLAATPDSFRQDVCWRCNKRIS